MRIYVFLLLVIVAVPTSACQIDIVYVPDFIYYRNLQLTVHSDVIEVDLYKVNDKGDAIKSKTISIDFFHGTVSLRQYDNRIPLIDSEQFKVRHNSLTDPCSLDSVLFADVNNTMEPVITTNSPYVIDSEANVVYRMFHNWQSGNYHLERIEIGSEWSFQHSSNGIASAVLIIPESLIENLFSPPTLLGLVIGFLFLIALYKIRKFFKSYPKKPDRDLSRHKTG